MSHPLNDVVWCKIAPSPIHGVGVFAIRDIPKGTDYGGGESYYEAEGKETILPEIWNLIQDHFLDIEYNCDVVVPNPNWDVVLQRFMNHSDDPNTDGTTTLRDIKKGEELTEDFTKVVQLGEKARAYFTFIK